MTEKESTNHSLETEPETARVKVGSDETLSNLAARNDVHSN